MARGRKKRAHRDEPLPAKPDRQAPEIERLRHENDQLRRQLEEQEERIADHERQLALMEQNSTITSKPPASDGLAGRPRARGRRVKSRRQTVGSRGTPDGNGSWCQSSAWTRLSISLPGVTHTGNVMLTPDRVGDLNWRIIPR